jgi:hypothetical protein
VLAGGESVLARHGAALNFKIVTSHQHKHQKLGSESAISDQYHRTQEKRRVRTCHQIRRLNDAVLRLWMPVLVVL